jgi:NAD dependent epimerase/dehydratase family enzyme
LNFIFLSAGVILGRNGGMIKQLFLPFYFGLGGPVGRGDQYMPWIHIDDMANLLLFAIENDDVQGVLNGVAPQVCSLPRKISNWN